MKDTLMGLSIPYRWTISDKHGKGKGVPREVQCLQGRKTQKKHKKKNSFKKKIRQRISKYS